MIKIENYIDGELVTPINDRYLPNYEPATGLHYSDVPESDASDVQAAVEAAEQAASEWARTPAERRAQYLWNIAEGIETKLSQLAKAEAIDNGKPLSLAQTVDIPRAAANFRFFAHAITQFSSEAHIMEEVAINYTHRHPLGVVGCISPWNLPLYLFTWKIAPALAAGNTVVAKPSELTPMTAYLLAEICIENDLPPGVLNIIHGTGLSAGVELVKHPTVKAISFTGGTNTGADIARIAAPMFKKLSLELGGKNPVLIFADCDYEKMLQTTVASSFRNQGQICLCGSRIFVERSIYNRFKADFIARVKELTIGDPLLPTTQMGAVVSEAHQQKILSYIRLPEGGEILTGGDAVRVPGRCEKGWFVAPTVIEGRAYDCRTNQEEIFGLVVTLTPFDTEEEVLQYANSTPYGLAAVVWTNHLQRAHRVAAQLQTGIVWVNCWMLRDLRTPFGGMKNSGVGREGGFEALRFFTDAQNVCVHL